MTQYYPIACQEKLLRYQRSNILEHDHMPRYPIHVDFPLDFHGYLVHNKDLERPVRYEFSTLENANMSLTTFLENFWFARKRKFGMTRIRSIAQP